MKKYYTSIWLPLACALIPALGLNAQDTNDEDSEVFELSPFTVTGDDDIGYQAVSTLAGTRLKTNMRDMATSISVVNAELLRDTGATDLEDVMLITPNTEVAGMGGNYSATQYAGAGNIIPEGNRDDHQGGFTRVRGLAAADLTRDYFRTDVAFDTYNTDRIAVQRGANSALFGLGSPGGVVNATPIRANFMGNKGELKFTTDEFGTLRTSVRYNHELMEDTLAIRVAGLYENQKYIQEEAFLKDKRIYGSLLWKVFDGIQVHASVEFGESDSAKPDFVPPNDGITPWLLAGKPISENPLAGAQLFRGTGDFFPPEASNSTNSRLLSVDTAGASSGFVEYFGDVNDPNPTFGGTPFVRAGQGTPDDAEYMMIRVRPMIRTMKLTGGYYPGGETVAPGTANFFSSGFVDQQITDRSIFDYRKHLFSGGSSTQGDDWRIIQGSIEGNWWDNKVGVELAVFDQTMDSWGYNALQGIEQRTIYIDINKYLIAQDSSGNWIPNPGFGKPAMGGGYGGNYLTDDRTSIRGTAYIELAATDFMEDNWISRLIGRFRLTGVYQERDYESSERYGGRGGIDMQAAADALAGGDILGMIYANYYKGMQFSLPSGEGVDFLSANTLDDVRGANIGAVPYGSDRSNFQSPGTFVGWDTVGHSFVTFESPVYRLDNDPHGYEAAFYAGKSKLEIDSQVLLGQYYFWDDTIVLTGTWRNDVVRSGSVGAPGYQPYNDGRAVSQHDDMTDPNFVAGVTDVSEDADEDTTSWGIVIHTPPFIEEFLPWGTTFSIYRGKADNFQPSGSRVNIYNEQIDSVMGTTDEKGIIVSTLNGKFNARFNWFDTGIINNGFEAAGFSSSEGILQNLVWQLNNSANVSQGFTQSDVESVLPPQGVLDLNGFNPTWSDPDSTTTNRNSSDQGTQDFTATGMEIEITYNPTPRWTILLTIAQQETITSNTYPRFGEYINDFVIPTWVNSSFAQNYFINEDATMTLAEVAQANLVDNYKKAITNDGTPAVEQREWRWRLNTSYNFGRNSDIMPKWLGEFTIGGGIRWEDEVGIGFHVNENEFGELAYDASDPFYGPSMTYYDIFFRARYRLDNRSDLILQLNIDDIGDHDELIPFYAQPDGSKLYRIQQGRVISFSATLTF